MAELDKCNVCGEDVSLHTHGIKCCLHCGECEDVQVRPEYYSGGAIEVKGKKFYYVECLPCGARTRNHFDGDAELEGFKDGKEYAIYDWNRRVNGLR